LTWISPSKKLKNIGTMQILTAPMAAAKSHFLRCLLPIQLRGRCTVRLLLSHTKDGTQTINAAALCRMAFTKIEDKRTTMKINTKNKLLQRRRAQQLGSLLSVAAISISTAAAENTAPPASDDQAGLPSVTVTATRREASLRSVPVAVSVLNGDLLEQANRNSIDSIAAELPSVNFQQGGNKDSTIFVRGIGTISTSPSVEPTVSTVVDGVVFARPG
jgi:hypothetical protein